MKALLETILQHEQEEKLREFLQEQYAIDIALVLEEIDASLLGTFVEMVEDQELADILTEAGPDLQTQFIDRLSFERASRIFQRMSPDDVVDILGNVPVAVRKHYLSRLNAVDNQDIEVMLDYDPQSAGGLMTTEFITLWEELHISQAFTTLKQLSPNTEVIDTLFIRDGKGQLTGSINIRDLFINQDQLRLKEVMNTQLLTVTTDTDQEEVAQLTAKYDLSVVPVINAHKVLVGIITIDDIIDVMQEEYHEDLLHMGGLSDAEQIGDPFFDSLKKRLPWLLINLATAFLASATVAAFDGLISQVVALAAVAPLITGMGGNSASQTLALVLQGITLGKLDLKEDKKLVIKEISLALANGFCTGLVAAVVMFAFYQNIYLSIIVVLAMMLNLAVGAIFGYFVPLILKAIHLDPALASSIFITTATDVFGYFAFLGLAQLFLSFLG